MGWLYLRFAAINVENRGNGHTWQAPDIGNFIRRSRISAYKIAKCVARHEKQTNKQKKKTKQKQKGIHNFLF